MSESLRKKAALVIEELAKERDNLESQVEELETKLAHVSEAAGLTMKLYKMGAFPMEDFEDKFNELSNKSVDELKTFEKAAELIGGKGWNMGPNIGTLSDDPEYGLSPEERFIQNIIDF